jgi:hypothetical protein
MSAYQRARADFGSGCFSVNSFKRFRVITCTRSNRNRQLANEKQRTRFKRWNHEKIKRKRKRQNRTDPVDSRSPDSLGRRARRPMQSIEIRSLPTLTHCFPRSFTFYVAQPKRSIRRLPSTAYSFAHSIARKVIPSSRSVPFARRSDRVRLRWCKRWV